MRNFINGFLTFVTATVFTSVAQADLVKPVELDIVCLTSNGDVFKVKSTPTGSLIQRRGETHVFPSQFIAATEGGAPYIQFVDESINIALGSDDLTKAFSSNLKVIGGLEGNITFLADFPEESFQVFCNGEIGF